MLAGFEGDVGHDVVVIVGGIGVGEFGDLLGAGDLALGVVVVVVRRRGWVPVVGLNLSLRVLLVVVMLELLAVVGLELSRWLLVVLVLRAVPGELPLLWGALDLLHVGPWVAGHESGIVDLVGDLLLGVVFWSGGVR